MLAGVCAGLGRHTGMDPVLFRVGFAVLVIGSGIGIFLYIAAFLLMRCPDGRPGHIEQWTRRSFDAQTVLALLAAVFAFGLIINLASGGISVGTIAVATLLAIALLTAHSRGVDLLSLVKTLPEHVMGRRGRLGTPTPGFEPRLYDTRRPGEPLHDTPPRPAGAHDDVPPEKPRYGEPRHDEPPYDEPRYDRAPQDGPQRADPVPGAAPYAGAPQAAAPHESALHESASPEGTTDESEHDGSPRDVSSHDDTRREASLPDASREEPSTGAPAASGPAWDLPTGLEHDGRPPAGEHPAASPADERPSDERPAAAPAPERPGTARPAAASPGPTSVTARFTAPPAEGDAASTPFATPLPGEDPATARLVPPAPQQDPANAQPAAPAPEGDPATARFATPPTEKDPANAQPAAPLPGEDPATARLASPAPQQDPANASAAPASEDDPATARFGTQAAEASAPASEAAAPYDPPAGHAGHAGAPASDAWEPQAPGGAEPADGRGGYRRLADLASEARAQAFPGSTTGATAAGFASGEPFAPHGPYDRPAAYGGDPYLDRPYDLAEHRPAPAVAAPRRRRSFIGLVTMLLALIIGGIMVAAHPGATAQSSLTLAGGAALITIGGGLLVAAWFGRGAGLVAAGTLVSLALVATTAFNGLPTNVGSFVWAPVSAAQIDHDYSVSIGDGKLDLSDTEVAPGSHTTINASVSLGELKVIVPPTARVDVYAHSRLGDVKIDHSTRSGPNVRFHKVLSPEVEGKGEPPTFELHLKANVGDVEVHRAG